MCFNKETIVWKPEHEKVLADLRNAMTLPPAMKNINYWSEELARCNMIIQHRVETKHIQTEWLSRSPGRCDCYLAGNDQTKL